MARHSEVPSGRGSAFGTVTACSHPAGAGRGRKKRSSVAAFCLAMVWGLACCSAALASSQRGHAFAFSFGGAGDGTGQFKFGGTFKLNEPVEVAVDEATGDVYVVDRGNHRLQEFGPKGEFISAWGWGVADGQEKYEVCTSACQPGLAGSGKGEFNEPGAIAVDNSPLGAQEVYVDMNASAKHPDIERFPADGERPLGKLPIEEEGRVDGLAVDAHGTVWIYRGEEEEVAEIEGFTDGAKPTSVETISSPMECPKPGLAVDAAGASFYIDHELFNAEEECPAAVEHREARPIVTTELNSKQEVRTGSEDGIDRESTTGVAVEQESAEDPLGAIAGGDLYIDNGTSVAAFTASGSLLQRFGGEQLQQGEGIAVDSKEGKVYVVDAAEARVDVFEPEQPAKPSVDGVWAENLAPGEAKLNATVDRHGADTSVYFQYGTVDCVKTPSACTDAPAPPGIDLGGADDAQGFIDVHTEVAIQGLQPSTTYYYRVIASNPEGPGEDEDTFGTITTLPAPQELLPDDRAWEIVSPPEKDGSEVQAPGEGELPAPLQASGNGSAIAYGANGPVEPNPEGNRAPEATQVLSTRGSEGWSSKDMVTPHERGEGLEDEPGEYRFFSADLSLTLVQPLNNLTEPLEAPPLAPGATEKTLYLRDDPPLAPEPSEQTAYTEAEANRGFRAPGYLPLVTPLTDTANTKFGGQLDFLDATPDLSHVIFESREAAILTGEAPGLYEWEAGTGLQLVSVLPDGAPAGDLEVGDSPELGDENVNVRNAVSENGSHVIFYSEGPEEGSESVEYRRLYLRDVETKESIQLNAAQGVSEPIGSTEEGEVGFQGASSDGSVVFFTDTEPLTPESGQRPRFGSEHDPGDLYACEISREAEGKLKCDLTDLTPLRGGSAEVLNVAPGISEGGSYVYFVANGALTPDASQGSCEAREIPVAQQSCNLYLWNEGQITLIAKLSGEDSGDWGSANRSGGREQSLEPRPDLANVTAGASPDGQYFAFMSKVPLTGYDNLDANHAAENAHDQEVYLYNAASRLLVCASCNSRGPSVGVHDTESSGEGKGLLVDRLEDWTGQYLAGSIPGWVPMGKGRGKGALHQPRYLSDGGRLFFNSPDDLVGEATNGKEDVYEYERDGEGSCDLESSCVSLISSGIAQQESTFLDASEGGDDAFFLTAEPLVSADHDTNFDVYDARVCTEAPCLSNEQTSKTTCETARLCNVATSSPPAVVLPASATTQSTGNLGTLAYTSTKPSSPPRNKPKPLTPKQELASALKQCHRKASKKKRAFCEKQARKRYKLAVRKKRGAR